MTSDDKTALSSVSGCSAPQLIAPSARVLPFSKTDLSHHRSKLIAPQTLSWGVAVEERLKTRYKKSCVRCASI